MPAAAATASIIRPSRAPCRSPPVRSRRRNSCSSAAALPSRSQSRSCRRAREPRPVMPGIRPMARSTSRTSSAGAAAGGASTDQSEAAPTPTRPWRGAPVRNPTTTSISSGAACERISDRPATLARRDRVEAMRREAATTSASFIGPSPPTAPRPGRGISVCISWAGSPHGHRASTIHRSGPLRPGPGLEPRPCHGIGAPRPIRGRLSRADKRTGRGRPPLLLESKPRRGQEHQGARTK